MEMDLWVITHMYLLHSRVCVCVCLCVCLLPSWECVCVCVRVCVCAALNSAHVSSRNRLHQANVVLFGEHYLCTSY